MIIVPLLIRLESKNSKLESLTIYFTIKIEVEIRIGLCPHKFGNEKWETGFERGGNWESISHSQEF